jgi:hypothetical protein
MTRAGLHALGTVNATIEMKKAFKDLLLAGLNNLKGIGGAVFHTHLTANAF